MGAQAAAAAAHLPSQTSFCHRASSMSALSEQWLVPATQLETASW